MDNLTFSICEIWCKCLGKCYVLWIYYIDSEHILHQQRQQNLLALQSPEPRALWSANALKAKYPISGDIGDHKILCKYANTKISLDPPESYCCMSEEFVPSMEYGRYPESGTQLPQNQTLFGWSPLMNMEKSPFLFRFRALWRFCPFCLWGRAHFIVFNHVYNYKCFE